MPFTKERIHAVMLPLPSLPRWVYLFSGSALATLVFLQDKLPPPWALYCVAAIGVLHMVVDTASRTKAAAAPSPAKDEKSEVVISEKKDENEKSEKDDKKPSGGPGPGALLLLAVLGALGAGDALLSTGCKDPATSASAQSFLLSAEQLVCYEASVLAGAQTQEEFKALCPMVPVLTKDVWDFVQKLMAANAPALDAGSPAAADAGVVTIAAQKAKLELLRRADASIVSAEKR